MNLTDIYFSIKENCEELKDYTPVPPEYRHLLTKGVIVKFCDIRTNDLKFTEGIVKKRTIDSLYLKIEGYKKTKIIKILKYFIFYKIDENDTIMRILDDFANNLE